MDIFLDVKFDVTNLVITPKTLAIISAIDELKGAWRALGTLAPERLSALRRVATIESIGASTRIEGSRLSDREVERLLSNLETKTLETRDEQEVAGYASVMEAVFASADSISSLDEIDGWPFGALMQQLFDLQLEGLRNSYSFEGDDYIYRAGSFMTRPGAIAWWQNAQALYPAAFQTAVNRWIKARQAEREAGATEAE